MTGWIKISRGIVEHWLWQDAERLKWWLDLLFLAEWKDRRVLHDAHLFTLRKGQIIASISFFSERWGKSNPTIIKYLKLLENEGMICRQVLYRQTPILTICNYEKYQAREEPPLDTQVDTIVDRQNKGNPRGKVDRLKNDGSNCNSDILRCKEETRIDTQVDTIVDTQVDTNKEYKEVKNIEKEIEIKKESRKSAFRAPSVEDVRLYVQEKSYAVDAEQFVNFYESKNWMVGKNKMSNWHAAVATWQKRERNNHGTDNRQRQESRRGSLEVTATTAEDYEGTF